jgi:predicted transcriptional regulator
MFKDIQQEFRELDRIYFSKTEESKMDKREVHTPLRDIVEEETPDAAQRTLMSSLHNTPERSLDCESEEIKPMVKKNAS